jgi:type IV pilus assembly protein PilC
VPKYQFIGKGPGGRPMRGFVSANSREEAVGKMRRGGIVVSELIEQEVKPLFGGGGGKISKRDIVLFTRQFAVMQDSGMGLVDTFEILAKQSKNKLLRSVILDIKGNIEGGSTLADALAKFPKYFDDLYVNMVRVGEMSGSLTMVFEKLSDYMERALKLAGQIKAAMVYPSVVIVAAIGIVWALLIFVVPIFEKVFAQAKGELPLPTQILVKSSAFVRENLLATIILLVVGVVVFKAWHKTPAGKYSVDKFLMKIPIIGVIVLKVSVSRFTTTLGSLISSGIPIVEGLDLASKATGNAVIGSAVARAGNEVIEGKPLAGSLEKTNLFPPMVVNMVRVGEETGALDKMLIKVNDFYEDEVDTAIKGLTSALEPLLIVGLGGLIAGFVVALYMPVFKLATAMGG